ncbi:MAG: thioredoxin family protein [Bacteroidales bacterium]|jgi:hypothetical protein|nr:thioredoxin family protein [Bacteroidales bacterium]
MTRSRILITLMLLIAITACSNKTSNNNVIKEIKGNGRFVQQISIGDIDTIVSTNPFTIIYCWGVWCKPCINSLQNEISKYLDTANTDSIKFIPLCIGGNENKVLKVLNSINFQYGSYLFASGTAFDKYVLNNKFSNLFENYKKVNYVPFVLLLNNKKKILNYDTIDERYYTLYEVFEKIK